MSPKIVIIALISTVYVISSTAAPAQPSAAKACAAYDVHLLTQLEDSEPQTPAAGFSLATAITMLIAARAACARGDFDRGLDLYSRIDFDAPPAPVASRAEAR